MAEHDRVARSGEALLDSLREASVGPGELVFWWCGQHTFIVKTPSALIFIDPYLKPSERRTKAPLLTPEQCGDFDLVLCTHDHSDHIDPEAIPGIAAAGEAVFVAPTAHRERMLSLDVPEDRLRTLDADESLTVGATSIEAVKAAHEFFERTPAGHFPFLGYLVREAGVSVYHAGDTLWWEGLQARLREAGRLDVALVPINGRDAERYRRNTLGNMSFAEAADLVGPLDVGLAVPTHFDMFVHNSEDPTRFTDYMAAKYPDTPTWLGPAGEPVRVLAQQ